MTNHLQKKEEFTRDLLKVEIFESQYFIFEKDMDMETGRETASVRSKGETSLMPLITLSKEDGSYSIQLSTGGRSGLTPSEVIQMSNFYLIAAETAEEVMDLLQ